MKAKKDFNKNVVASLLTLFCLVAFQFYTTVQDVSAATANDDVIVTLDVTTGITISDGADATMTPNLSIVSDSSIGSSSWLVKTNAALGYTLAVKASTTPALESATSSLANYTETVLGTPEAWSVGVGDKEFGYSAYGTDTPTGVWGTAASCGAGGVPDALQSYVGFSTSDKTIATRATVTPTTGILTTICFAAEQNAVYAASGTYTATITATATTL